MGVEPKRKNIIKARECGKKSSTNVTIIGGEWVSMDTIQGVPLIPSFDLPPRESEKSRKQRKKVEDIEKLRRKLKGF